MIGDDKITFNHLIKVTGPLIRPAYKMRQTRIRQLAHIYSSSDLFICFYRLILVKTFCDAESGNFLGYYYKNMKQCEDVGK